MSRCKAPWLIAAAWPFLGSGRPPFSVRRAPGARAGQHRQGDRSSRGCPEPAPAKLVVVVPVADLVLPPVPASPLASSSSGPSRAQTAARSAPRAFPPPAPPSAAARPRSRHSRPARRRPSQSLRSSPPSAFLPLRRTRPLRGPDRPPSPRPVEPLGHFSHPLVRKASLARRPSPSDRPAAAGGLSHGSHLLVVRRRPPAARREPPRRLPDARRAEPSRDDNGAALAGASLLPWAPIYRLLAALRQPHASSELTTLPCPRRRFVS